MSNFSLPGGGEGGGGGDKKYTFERKSNKFSEER